MTIIDHRILIPAAPDVVWNYISDITHNPDWQVDCRDVIFLTSRREGPGVRWRYAAPNGHEYVTAVTAWYNGLGYEYYLVDGAPYRENKGRIRLQEIPEGTIVQWTFTYELGGVFGGMRNALGLNRQVDQTIAESLKMLWQKIKESGAASRPHEAKSLMRDAPNVDARSSYQPRHPAHGERPETQKAVPVPAPTPAPRFQAEPPVSEDDGQPISVIAEPPIEQDDTRPRPPVTLATPAEPLIPADLEGEPDFLERATDLSMFEPPRDASDTQPRKPIVSLEPTATEAEAEAEEESPFAPPRTPRGEETEPLAVTPPEVLPDYRSRAPLTEAPKIEPPPAAAPEPEPITEPVATVEEAESEAPSAEPEPEAEALLTVDEQKIEPAPISIFGEPEPDGEATPTTIIEQKSEAEVEAAPDEPATPVAPVPPTPSPETKPDGDASIWEIFGVPRPSETQETPAIQPEPSAATAEPVAAPEAEPALAEAIAAPVGVTVALPATEKVLLPRGSSRIGLRIVLRRKLARVRRP